MDTIVRDVAKSVGWVHANIDRYGGDATRMFLIGHSAGTQLAALLCTDSGYIEAEGRSADEYQRLHGCRGDTYHVPLQVATPAVLPGNLMGAKN